MEELKVGDLAPDFVLPSSRGNQVTLSQFRGRTVILYFYPKDNTSGCTQEACDFRDAFPQFDEKNVVILGVSKDGIKSHINFSTKYDLPFELLSDESTGVHQMYGVWKEKSMYGKTYMGAERTTFVINSEGIILDIHRKVKVKGHIDTILKAL